MGKIRPQHVKKQNKLGQSINPVINMPRGAKPTVASLILTPPILLLSYCMDCSSHSHPLLKWASHVSCRERNVQSNLERETGKEKKERSGFSQNQNQNQNQNKNKNPILSSYSSSLFKPFTRFPSITFLSELFEAPLQLSLSTILFSIYGFIIL